MPVWQFTGFVVLLKGRSPAPLPPRRDPKTTLSVGRARARSMVTGLGKPHPFGSFNHAVSTLEIIFGAQLFKTQ
jgi:hypothetical protein